MDTIAVVSPQVETWGAFVSALEQHGIKNVMTLRSGTGAMAAAREKSPVAIVIDQDLGDMPGIDLVSRLLEINALINVALVSDLTEDAFHEATEGLGILMKLSPDPGGQAAADFCELLKGVV